MAGTDRRGPFWVLLAALTVGAGSSMASTAAEEDTIVINRLGPTEFEVVQGVNFGAAEFWCGAATYVERRTGQPQTTPIFVKSPRGPSQTVAGRDSVVFSTSAEGLPAADPNRVTLTVDRAGATLKSYQARRYCRDTFTRSTK
ncbi:hypothetical protein [Sulfitobacter alexandrii]|nr:hypothetical protein [Sulfitobacter alexandrii]